MAFLLSGINFQKGEKTISINMSISPTKTISIEEIYDYDPTSPQTGYTKPDSYPFGEVNFGYLTPGTHIIGSIPNYYAIKINIISNQYWSLYLYSMTNLIGQNNQLPISKLMYSINDSSSFTSFTLTPKKIMQGGPTNSNEITFDLLLYLKMSDPPDSYGAEIKIEVH